MPSSPGTSGSRWLRRQIVAADWQEGFIPRLDTPEGQAALEPFVDNADLIFFDNLS